MGMGTKEVTGKEHRYVKIKVLSAKSKAMLGLILEKKDRCHQSVGKGHPWQERTPIPKDLYR